MPHYRVKFFEALSGSPHFELTVAYGKAPPRSSLISQANVPFSKLHLRNFFLGDRGILIWQSGLLSLVSSRKFDVIIAEFNVRILSSVLASLLLRNSRHPFIWWGHGIGNRPSGVSVQLCRLLCHVSRAVILYDAQRAERMVSLGVPREKVFVAPNSVDTERISQISQHYKQQPRTRILYVGRLTPEKKVGLLLKGFALAFPYLSPGTTLTVIGDGPEAKALEAQARALGIASGVEFVGEIVDERLLAPYFMSAWVSVAPGCVGLLAIHSMAYAVPLIVADNEPHGPEIVAVRDGVNALLFQSGNADSLAGALRRLANDPECLSRISGAAYQTVKNEYSLANMVRAFECAVDYVLRTRRTPGFERP